MREAAARIFTHQRELFIQRRWMLRSLSAIRSTEIIPIENVHNMAEGEEGGCLLQDNKLMDREVNETKI